MTNSIRRTEPAVGGENRGRSDFGSALLAVFLFSEVAASIVGAGAVFFACIVFAWLVILAVVGFRDVLDAGCVFMLVSLGIVVVVDFALRGPIVFPP